MNTKNDKIYDLIILGAGPGGLSASIYASRYMMDFVTIGQLPGGTVTEAHMIENYPGLGKISGNDLVTKMTEHAKSLGTEILQSRIKKIAKKGDIFELFSEKEIYRAKRILFATGTQRNKLNVEGEDRLLGRGVSYCATCDGAFFKNKNVCVVGGGNSAVTAALYLSDIAKKIYLTYRGDKLKAEPIWVKDLERADNVEILYNTNVTKIAGKEKVESVKLDKEGKTLKIDGIFIEIGSTPIKAFFSELNVKTDDKGYVVVDSEMKTSEKGIWAAGDITKNGFKFKQIVTASAEGAIAAYSIYLDIKK